MGSSLTSSHLILRSYLAFFPPDFGRSLRFITNMFAFICPQCSQHFLSHHHALSLTLVDYYDSLRRAYFCHVPVLSSVLVSCVSSPLSDSVMGKCRAYITLQTSLAKSLHVDQTTRYRPNHYVSTYIVIKYQHVSPPLLLWLCASL